MSIHIDNTLAASSLYGYNAAGIEVDMKKIIILGLVVLVLCVFSIKTATAVPETYRPVEADENPYYAEYNQGEQELSLHKVNSWSLIEKIVVYLRASYKAFDCAHESK